MTHPRTRRTQLAVRAVLFCTLAIALLALTDHFSARPHVQLHPTSTTTLPIPISINLTTGHNPAKLSP